MQKRGRGRPRKIKNLEQYTLSELRDMPMGPLFRLFLKDITGRKAVAVTSPKKEAVIFDSGKRKSGRVVESPRKSPQLSGTNSSSVSAKI